MQCSTGEIGQKEVESLLRDIDTNLLCSTSKDAKKENNNNSFEMSEELIFEDAPVGDDGWVSPLSSPLPGPKFTALKTPDFGKDSLESENLEVRPCPIPFIPHIELAKSSSSQMQSPVVPAKTKENCKIHFEAESNPKPEINNITGQSCMNSSVSAQPCGTHQTDYNVALRSLAARMSQSESTRMQLEKFVPHKRTQRRRSLDMTLNVSSASRQQIKALIECNLNHPHNNLFNTVKRSKATLQRRNSLDMNNKTPMKVVSGEWAQNGGSTYVYRQTSSPASQYPNDYLLPEKETKEREMSFRRRHSTLV